jgi:hypothetical protein
MWSEVWVCCYLYVTLYFWSMNHHEYEHLRYTRLADFCVTQDIPRFHKMIERNTPDTRGKLKQLPFMCTY